MIEVFRGFGLVLIAELDLTYSPVLNNMAHARQNQPPPIQPVSGEGNSPWP
jgi:hypothetical protein